MPTIPIEIDFKKPTATTKRILDYPRYTNLIEHTTKVVDAVRERLQIEPAFQFLQGTADMDTYEFKLTISPSNQAVFTLDGSKLYWTEVGIPAGAGPVTSATRDAMDPKKCSIVVRPSLWSSTKNAVTLRVYCHNPSTDTKSTTTSGVSLTLLKPGGTPAVCPAGASEPAAPDFDIKVLSFGTSPSGKEFPYYDVFQYAGGLPAPEVSLEPAFRVRDAAREQVRASITLPSGREFVHSTVTLDDVEVLERTPSRTPELSRVRGLPSGTGPFNTIFFDYRATSTAGSYSFFVYAANARSAPDAQPSALPHVDPVLINDPPPAPVP